MLRSKVHNYEELLAERNARLKSQDDLIDQLKTNMDRLAQRLKDAEKTIARLRVPVGNQNDTN